MKMPSFICIGAQKAGTTTLHEILKSHPDIYLPSKKEAHYFDKEERYKKGINWWINNFFSDANDERIIGVFTPDYLFFPNVPSRILSDLGEQTKFIVIFRHPVERAYSHYLMSLRRGHEHLPFLEALEEEKERITESYENADRYSYISRGYYSEQLKRYLDLFPKENFLFLSFENDIRKNIDQTIETILCFIDVEFLELKTSKKSNSATGVHSKSIQKVVRQNNLLKKLIKPLFPKKIRMKFKDKIIQLNEQKKITNTKLEQNLINELYNKYYSNEALELEKLTGINFSYWKGENNEQ